MKDYKEMTVGEIVADNFEHAEVFNKYGIDFCCNGNIPLIRACHAKEIEVRKVLEELKTSEYPSSFGCDFKTWPLDLLVDYVLKYHHRRIRENGPVILRLLEKVVKVHGSEHPSLYEVQVLFQESFVALEDHLMKEERILFPYINELIRAKEENRPAAVFHCGPIDNPIHAMMGEHAAEGERFRQIANLTGGYEAPEDACDSYRLVLRKLKAFDADLHHHIHLENNLIFPRAIELQSAL